MIINKKIATYTKALIASVSLLVASPSIAALTSTEILMSESFSGDNDCSSGEFHEDGYKGYSGFSACRIAIDDANGVTVYLSDVIAKFDTTSSSTPQYTESKQYEDDVAKSNWNFGKGTDAATSGNLDDSYKTGNWAYNITTPGIRFWTAKAGNGFNLFWIVDKENNATPGACDPNTFTLDCLNLAKTVTSGSWTTPLNGGGNQGALSHITFFGNACTLNCGGGGGTTPVPEPKTIMIFALALLALVVRQKRLALFNS